MTSFALARARCIAENPKLTPETFAAAEAAFATDVLPLFLHGAFSPSPSILRQPGRPGVALCQTLPVLLAETATSARIYDHMSTFRLTDARGPATVDDTVVVIQPYYTGEIRSHDPQTEVINLSKIDADWYYVGMAGAFLVAKRNLFLRNLPHYASA